MKKKTYTILLLIITQLSSFAQQNFKVEKIDNTNFPAIKVFISTQENLDLNKLSFSENNKPLKYICDTIEGEKYGNGSVSILFVINKSCKIEIINTLKKTIKKLSKNDRINLAVILNEEATKSTLHYMSPSFSNNHEYFLNLLNQKLFENISYENKNHKITNVIEKKIQQSQDIYSSKAIVFFIDNFYNTEIHSNILNQTKVPIYFLLTNQPDSAIQNKLSNISTASGGIYSVSKSAEYKKYINSYIEDISLNKNSKKNEMLRFIFETSQHKKKNFFKITYNNNTSQYAFSRLQENLLTFREQILLLLSGMLLIILVIVINRNKRIVKKLHLGLIKDFKPTTAIPVKNIEINVKTKGFNKTYFFEKHIIRIGRGEDNDIVIPDRTVSVSHALINREGNNFILQDLGSTNGVLINQKKIKKQNLKTNDKIKMGAAILIIRV